MPAWPETLPQALLLAGNSEAMPDGRLLSETDTGPGKMRRRTSAKGRPVSGTMLMTAAQLDDLEAFVLTDLVGGTLAFTFTKLRGEGTSTVRFVSLPSWSYLGADNFSVAIALEILQ